MATLGQQVLERVVAKFGGPDQAAVRLGITNTLMRYLLSGALPVTDSILLKAVDLLDATPASVVEPKSPKSPGAV